MADQNWFASFVLVAWPFVAAYLFATLRLNQAILWTIVGAQMALPAGAYFKIAMVPQLDKISIPNISILIGCLLASKRLPRVVGGMGIEGCLIIAYLVSPMITSELNGDPLLFGETVIPGVGLYDAISATESAFISIIPFIVARQFLRSGEDNKAILSVLALAGIAYSVPILYEVRMSPTLQYFIYGFSASSFIMEVRFGGYRPMVFMGHGLIVAFFMMTSAVAAAALWRARVSLRKVPPGGAAAYLGLVLLVCKSFGAILYGAILIPIVRFLPTRFHFRIALFLICIALAYPALRTFDFFPTQSLVDAANSVSSQRAQSLQFRFDNEDKLLKRALERPVFGWGRYGRNRVYNEDTGTDESVTDGVWILALGSYGIFGFLALFGLLSIGAFRAVSAYKLLKSKTELVLMGALTLLTAFNVVDLIPNSTLLPLTWLLCGALVGRSESAVARAKKASRQIQFTEDPVRTVGGA